MAKGSKNSVLQKTKNTHVLDIDWTDQCYMHAAIGNSMVGVENTEESEARV